MIIEEIKKKVAPILKESGVEYAGVFGSAARGEDTPESDIDIIVSVKKPISVYQFIALKYKLEEILGKKVDLVSKNSINKYVKPYIEKDIVDIYEGQ
ncbi:MAG: nucleotidyltransferase family protein [Patescibacteria group bacterium]